MKAKRVFHTMLAVDNGTICTHALQILNMRWCHPSVFLAEVPDQLWSHFFHILLQTYTVGDVRMFGSGPSTWLFDSNLV